MPNPDRPPPRIFGLAAWSGSGKTTLLVALLPVLLARGLLVSTVKHAHHAFDLDTPGKDSWRHRAAGAVEVMIASSTRWALMHEVKDDPEPELEDLIGHMSEVDLILVEGFKRHAHPKLEIVRPSLGKPRLYREDPAIVAIYAVEPLGPEEEPGLPVIAEGQIAEVADLVIARAEPIGNRT